MTLFCSSKERYAELLRRASVIFQHSTRLPDQVFRPEFKPRFFLEDVDIWIEALPTLFQLSQVLSGVGLAYVQIYPTPAYPNIFPALELNSINDVADAQVLLANGIDNLIDTDMRSVYECLAIIPNIDSPTWGLLADSGFEFAVFGSSDDSLASRAIELVSASENPRLMYVDDVADIIEGIFSQINPAYVERSIKALRSHYGTVCGH